MANIDVYSLTLPNDDNEYWLKDKSLQDAKGTANGIAELDSTGKVPSSQLPSYVDDVIEVADYSHLPITGETGKIYVTIDDNKTYRWSGTGYTEISSSLALGETSSTAYRGDRGKTAYNHATETKLSTATSSGLYKVASTAQGHIASLTAVQKADITALGIPGSDTKNTAGSTDTSSKIFLVGATSQAANPQTYSDDEVYATSGTLSSKKVDTKAIIALTGTGTAGSDKGSGVSPRYIPSLWTFNSGVTVANGEVYFIKIPVAGGTYGVWLSLNNGTNYYPVAVSNAKARFTAQYALNTVIAVSYESAGVCTCFPKTGGDSTSDVTGIFRVLNDYDANTTYSAMSTSELTRGTATSSRVVRADYLKSGINSLIDTKIGALDVTGGTNTAGKTVKAWSETDGKISLSFQDISITKSQVGLGNVDNTSDNTKKSNFTGSIAASNTGFVTGGDVYSALGDKVDKVNGKGLSTNDYTTAEKNKLSGIASGAEVNVQSDWSQSVNTKDDYIKNKPTKVSQFTNDSGFTKVESSETNGNIKIDGTETQVYDETVGNLSGSHTGICETAAATSAKIVTIGDGTWIPKEGDIIAVKFTYSNTTSFVTLNVNGIGNKSIWYGDSVDPSGADYICGKAGSYIFYMYDGTYWIWLNEGKHDGNNFPSVAVYTLSNQQVKIGTCNYYTLTNKSYCHFIFRYPNSYKGELFIKINNSSSKTIYINGEISSSTNYTLPAGTYIAYYENDKWYFRTDGKLTANITGTAASDSTKADKVASATNGNLAGLNTSGNLTDSGWASDKTTTSASGNPISITGLKSNQLAVNPVITFEPIQEGSGDPSPSNVRAISGYDKIEVLSCGKNLVSGRLSGYAINTNGRFATNANYDMVYAPVVKGASYVISSDNNAVMGWFEDKPTVSSQAYDATRHSYAVGIAYTAPITGWVAFRTVAGFATQVEYGASQSTYEAPNKTTDLSEPLPQTVYGGSLDLRSGKLTVDEVYLNLKGLTADSYMTTGVYFKNVLDRNVFRLNGICSHAHIRTTEPTFESGKIQLGTNDASVYWSDILTVMGKTITEFNTWLASEDVVICYKTPNVTTIQLTPHEISLLKDYAYVSTNGTSIALDYHNGEIATLGDVAQVGETVNLIGERVEFEDVSQYFVKNDTNIYSANISAYRIGKMVFISGSFVPNTLASLQNKELFNITNDKIIPLSATIPVTGTYIPIVSQSGTAWTIVLSINKRFKKIKTDNNGAYGAISNITTNSQVIFSVSYVCQG